VINITYEDSKSNYKTHVLFKQENALIRLKAIVLTSVILFITQKSFHALQIIMLIVMAIYFLDTKYLTK
jgi:hypothetical protein